MIKKIIEKFKTNYEKYPTTIIIVNLLSILFSIWIICENDNILNYGCLFLLISVVNSFFIESSIKKNKIIYITITTIISIIFTVFLNENTYEYINKLFAFYMISLPLVAIYFNYKKSNDKFYEYVTNVTYNTLVTSIIYGILALGILLVSLIFTYLIYETYKILSIFEVLAVGFYLIPSIICNFINKEKMIDLMELLVRKVLVVLLAIAYIIVYIYIFKMLITLNVPKNMVFMILTCVFLVSIVISLLMDYYKQKTIFDKFNNIIKYLNIGFIILQTYCITIRIVTSGLTTARYLCIAVLFLEIMYIIYKILERDLSELVFYVIGVLFISLLVPYINMYKLPCLVEYNIVKNYDVKKTYTNRELKKILGAYEYLEINDKDLFNRVVNTVDIETIDIKDEESVYLQVDKISINIEDYKYIEDFERSYYDYEETGKVTFNLFTQLQIGDKVINMYDNVLDLIKNDNEYFKNNNIIKSNGFDIYLQRLDIYYEGDNISYYNLTGFVLEK